MNWLQKKSPGQRGSPEPFKRSRQGPQFKPVVVHSKSHAPGPVVNRPIAPPAYKPQTRLAVAQSKSAIRSSNPNVPAVNVKRALTGPRAFGSPGKSTTTQIRPAQIGTKPVAPPVVHPHHPLTILQQKSNSNRNLTDARTTGQSPRPGQAPRQIEAPVRRAPSLVVRSSAIRVVQRAEDWSKHDDVWWPKDYRLNGPYKDADLWKHWGAANRFGYFSAPQIKLLIAENKKRNGGKLKSDSNTDPHKVLAETAGENDSVECDHVINRFRGGSNHWWNARLISRELNNSLERESEAKGK